MKQNLTLLLLIGLLISACSSSQALAPTRAGQDTPVVAEPTAIPPTASSTPTATPTPEEAIRVEDAGDEVEASSDLMLETFTPLCERASGVSQAAVYNRLAISPLIMIASGGENALNLSAELPGAWGAAEIERIELVVCIEFKEERLLQTCEYDVGSDVERYQQNYNVSVYEAITGAVVDQGIFPGALPRACQEQELIELERLDGGIDFDPIILWLCQFVDPTCPPREPNGNYLVNDGDTCESIAAAFGVSIESMIQINGLSAACELLVGTELVIP
ncbi:MAG: LysM peptidoglycan-binding domain-containing protein [Anaerolineales bacterium]|nr:LysM peptidoglycan-binding domain-containing protein [Anaerolineales bacterium]